MKKNLNFLLKKLYNKYNPPDLSLNDVIQDQTSNKSLNLEKEVDKLLNTYKKEEINGYDEFKARVMQVSIRMKFEDFKNHKKIFNEPFRE